MKVLYLTNGGSVHDYRFLSKLSDAGIEVDYAHLSKAGTRLTIRGVRSHYLGYEGMSPGSRGFGLVVRWRVYRRFRRLLLECRPDILHAGWVQTAGMMAAVSGYHPFLLMPWGSDVLLYPNRGVFAKWLTRNVIRRADAVVCDCLAVRQRIIDLAAYPPERIGVFPWGVDLSLFASDSELGASTRRRLGWGDRMVVLMNRSFKPVYAVDDFIRAVPQILRSVPHALVVLIGSGPMAAQLEALVQQLGLSAAVRFLGEVANDEMPAYLNAADIFVSSSVSDGASLSLLEAMACGLPVVVTDIPSNLEWVNDGVNGRVVPTRSPAELANSVVELLLDPDKRREMAGANIAVARARADWNDNFKILEQTYRELVRVPLSEPDSQ